MSALLDRFTKSGDAVFDPFVGLGTTFFVCEQKGRIPYGIETDRQRYEWVRERITTEDHLFSGDSAGLAAFGLPEMEFCITSPPYMPHWHKWNPLDNGDPNYDGYDVYLKRMQEIHGQICQRLKTNAYLVVQADNLTSEKFSPLAWDLGRALSEVMMLEGEIMVTWSEAVESGNCFTQCLVFKNAS
ncbi:MULTISPECIES: DNA methyltransferase [unclassified Rhizobium]|uniref:DNA methyltransferase n=1 Tax=unclassified Rhizobium TaxID=2613769 RepID=UPI0007F0FF23|nr:MULTISPECIES: DNA methyltransferase [unclassified Rhizobium]ANM08917.1 restriction/modification DNA methylase protein [Rhizobium sp. N324]ANM15431.1 restriction/modification DNA methylase protein [Rhizobium sp. N541]ANM21819.1 restriction/modification DNA methylase protein [Rhizobium sp. N941]OYD02483.1 restriction/modification DNA methylase protein [Rhizobium sp. N4311]